MGGAAHRPQSKHQPWLCGALWPYGGGRGGFAALLPPQEVGAERWAGTAPPPSKNESSQPPQRLSPAAWVGVVVWVGVTVRGYGRPHGGWEPPPPQHLGLWLCAPKCSVCTGGGGAEWYPNAVTPPPPLSPPPPLRNLCQVHATQWGGVGGAQRDAPPNPTPHTCPGRTLSSQRDSPNPQ